MNMRNPNVGDLALVCQYAPSVVFYFRFLVAVFVVIAFLDKLFKVVFIHNLVTVNTNPSQEDRDIVQTLII
jgi:hypothetical protein